MHGRGSRGWVLPAPQSRNRRGCARDQCLRLPRCSACDCGLAGLIRDGCSGTRPGSHIAAASAVSVKHQRSSVAAAVNRHRSGNAWGRSRPGAGLRAGGAQSAAASRHPMLAAGTALLQWPLAAGKRHARHPANTRPGPNWTLGPSLDDSVDVRSSRSGNPHPTSNSRLLSELQVSARRRWSAGFFFFFSTPAKQGPEVESTSTTGTFAFARVFATSRPSR